MRTPVTVGVVGLDVAGRRLARAFGDLPQASICWLCDLAAKSRLSLRSRHPGALQTADIADLLADESLDAVAIATPAVTHYELALLALEADKHVLVQPPLALRRADAEELARVAESRNRRVVAAHSLPFNPALRKLKEQIELGRLGELYYFSGSWRTLARTPGDAGVLWTLGPEAVAAILDLVADEPFEATALVDWYEQPAVPELASCYLRFATGITATFQLSTLDPHRVSRLEAVGSRRAAVFDELEPERKLTVYEKGSVQRRGDGAFGEPRFGEIVSPRIVADDPVRLLCESFLEAVRRPADRAPDRLGPATVGVLEALERSARAQPDREATGERGAAGRLIQLPVRPHTMA